MNSLLCVNAIKMWQVRWSTVTCIFLDEVIIIHMYLICMIKKGAAGRNENPEGEKAVKSNVVGIICPPDFEIGLTNLP